MKLWGMDSTMELWDWIKNLELWDRIETIEWCERTGIMELWDRIVVEISVYMSMIFLLDLYLVFKTKDIRRISLELVGEIKWTKINVEESF